MKRLMVIILSMIMFMCFTSSVLAKDMDSEYTITQIPFNTRDGVKIQLQLNLPKDVPDIVELYSHGMTVQRLNETICILVFPMKNIVDHYQLIVKCSDPVFLILVEIIGGNQRFWIYSNEKPVEVTKEKAQDFLVLQFGKEREEIEKINPYGGN